MYDSQTPSKEIEKQSQGEHNKKLIQQYSKIKIGFQISIDISVEEYQKIRTPYLLGNNRIYKRQIQNKWIDKRVEHLPAEYFTNKNALDLGCGAGITTLLIGMKYFPFLIHGVDIDKRNIEKASVLMNNFIKKNQHYQAVLSNNSFISNIKQLPLFFQQKSNKLGITYTIPSNLTIVPQSSTKPIENYFPKNVVFVNQNLYHIKGIQIYDTIVCLKITKWLHLCFGDQAIYQLFLKIASLLKKGGVLILQAQNWASYKKKKTANEFHKKMFPLINDRPDKFSSLLFQFGLKEVNSISNQDLKYPLKIYQKS